MQKKYRNRLSVLGMICALIIGGFLLSKNNKEVTVNCNDSFCYLMLLPLKEQNLKISNTPDEYIKKFSGIISIESQIFFLPITIQKITQIKESLSNIVIQKKYLFTQSLEQGLKTQKSLDRIFIDAGWAHYFCLSGWHAQYLHKISKKNSFLFFLLSSLTSYLLLFPFPFLRSLAHIICKCPYKALGVALLFQPLAPLTITFWLTLYYQFLIRLTNISKKIFILSSFCLCQIFTGYVSIFIFIFFQTIGNRFASTIIFMIVLSKLFGYFNIEMIKKIDYFLEEFAEIVLYYGTFKVHLPQNICFFILCLLLTNIKYRSFKHKGFQSS